MKNEKLKFSFKSTTEKDPVTDKPVLDDKGEAKKIPAPAAIELEVPQFETLEDVAAELMKPKNEDGTLTKAHKLILEMLNTAFVDQAKSLIDEDREAARANGIDLTKLTWDFIANIPANQRKSDIDEATWEAFGKDYVAVMVHHGKTQEQAEMGAKLLVKKFAPVRINKKVIAALKENLVLWFANTEKAEDLSKVYENLITKAGTLLAADEEAILAAV